MNLEQNIKEKTPESFDIRPVTDVQEIENLLGGNQQQKIAEILKDMENIIPLTISLPTIPDILQLLIKKPSSELNKVWIVNNEIVGFLVFEEHEDQELYIKYFGAKKLTNNVELILILGNIRSIIKKASKSFKKLSLHGFNETLNKLFINRFGFEKDQTQNLHYQNKDEEVTVPYLYLDLNQDNQFSQTEKKENDIDLTILKELLQEKVALNEENWLIIQNKTSEYLKKIGKTIPENGWSSLADAISQHFDAITKSNMGIGKAIEQHKKRNLNLAKNFRQELAKNNESSAQLVTSYGELDLFELLTESQLKQESAIMNHCVGDVEQGYYKKIVNNKSRIFSLRDKSNAILVTIEYDVRKKEVKQIKKSHDHLIDGKENWFQDFLYIIKQLKKLNPPIEIKQIRDMENIKLPPNTALNIDGEVINLEQLQQTPPTEIIQGNFEINNNFSDEEIQYLCQTENITLNTTKLTNKNKKDNIKSVTGNLIDRSSLSLTNLETIEGDLNISNSSMKSLNKLTYIGGSFNITGTKINSLNNLITIGGNFRANSSRIKNIPKLQKINGYADLSNSSLSSLDNLETINGFLDLNFSNLKSLPKLTVIKGKIDLSHTIIESLNNLQLVEGDLRLSESNIASLNSLKEVTGNLIIESSKLTNLDNLETVGGGVYMTYANISLKKLKKIGDYLLVRSCQIKDIDQLEYIGGNTTIEVSNLESLKSLKIINGYLKVSSFYLKKMGYISKLGKYAFFKQNNKIRTITINGKMVTQ